MTNTMPLKVCEQFGKWLLLLPNQKIVSSEYYNFLWPFILKKSHIYKITWAFFPHLQLQTQPTRNFLTLNLYCLGKGAEGPSIY